jgi:hypothetical protein
MPQSGRRLQHQSLPKWAVQERAALLAEVRRTTYLNVHYFSGFLINGLFFSRNSNARRLRDLGRPCGTTMPLPQMLSQLSQCHAVEYPFSRNATFAGHGNPPMGEVEFTGGVSVRIDAHEAT